MPHNFTSTAICQVLAVQHSQLRKLRAKLALISHAHPLHCRKSAVLRPSIRLSMCRHQLILFMLATMQLMVRRHAQLVPKPPLSPVPRALLQTITSPAGRAQPANI